MTCPSCHGDNVVTLNHEGEAAHADCPQTHAYCEDCDNGLCCGEC